MSADIVLLTNIILAIYPDIDLVVNIDFVEVILTDDGGCPIYNGIVFRSGDEARSLEVSVGVLLLSIFAPQSPSFLALLW
jgi:hypothetical protein